MLARYQTARVCTSIHFDAAVPAEGRAGGQGRGPEGGRTRWEDKAGGQGGRTGQEDRARAQGKRTVLHCMRTSRRIGQAGK